jgi:hypothetical protein
MNKSDSIKALSAALAKAQASLKNAKNSADNPFYKSKYAPLGDVLDLIRPALASNGLAIVQYPSSEDGKAISIHTMITHESGEYIDFDPLTLTAEKITPQGAGAAITYGRRYSVSGIFNIASEDDDDGNSLESNKATKNSLNTNTPKPATKPSKQATAKSSDTISIDQAKGLQTMCREKWGVEGMAEQNFEMLTGYAKFGRVKLSEYEEIVKKIQEAK